MENLDVYNRQRAEEHVESGRVPGLLVSWNFYKVLRFQQN